MKGFYKLNLKEVDFKKLDVFFKNLILDKNDKELYNKIPFRSRKILFTKFIMNKLSLTKKKTFSQNVNDKRKKPRVFSVMKVTKEQLLLLENLLKILIKKSLKKISTIPNNFDVTFHFVRVNASISGESNSPEGIHRDGFDLLFPCIVVKRHNIKGGMSRFFIKRNKEYKQIYSKVIKEKECLVADEKNYKDLYHDVTPIFIKNNKKPGYSDIIGIDIKFK